ncbi:MAG: sodium:solute symporter [Paludibacteraceae bacterium]|nr:sodium:solute symporter [Paludibacteraceae bacterium]
MSPILILVTIFAYFALLFVVSYIAGRKADNAGFFSGNKSSNWIVVAMSTIGAAISGVTFVSVPGMVQGVGFSYLQMVLGFMVGQILIAYVLIPLYYKLQLTSIYEYINNRFGLTSYKTSAWIFFVSKMLGASVRLFVVSFVLQELVFAPLGMPFVANVFFTILIVYLCTFRGGVKSIIWTDLLKTCCLILTVGLCIYFILRSGVTWDGFGKNEMSRVFFLDNPRQGTYFWKQFLAGIFLVLSTTGLDQDMMQRTLSCKNTKDSQKNMITGGVLQVFVNALFLVLGYLLYSFANTNGINIEGHTGDGLFPYLATGNFFPTIVGVMFIVGFIAAAYSAGGSALTALTTSFSVDILNLKNTQQSEAQITQTRQKVHIMMSCIMAICIYVIYLLNDDSVIQTVYKVASYTYGPLLGMFCFGIFLKYDVKDRWVPLVVVLAPIITWILDANSQAWLAGYTFSHERLLVNAFLTILGMILIKKTKHE